MENLNLTNNEKKVITLLYRHGELSKQKISDLGKMGWATAVKMINRLTEGNFICESGLEKSNSKGKRAALYGLSKSFPLAIGVDVEYHETKLALINLSGTILVEKRFITPQVLDDLSFLQFLKQILSEFIVQNIPNRDVLAGIGIGIPGIGVYNWDQNKRQEKSEIMSENLSTYYSTNVKVEVNTRAYSVFERWNNGIQYNDDFIFVSIRTGVGTGIFQDGKLMVGSNGLAGEIGHIQVKENGKRCRCGKTGCMETETNVYTLYSRYSKEILGQDELKTDELDSIDRDTIRNGLKDLFNLANEDNSQALSIVRELARYLGYCISCAIMVLDIKRVIISANFGMQGAILAPLVEEEIKSHCFSNSSTSVTYYPFSTTGHTRGAALLILNKYFTTIDYK